MNRPSESNVLIPVNGMVTIDETAPIELSDAIFIQSQTPIPSPLSTSSCSTNFEVPSTKKPREKRKRSDDTTERTSHILEQIGSIETELKKSQEDDNEDSLYCRSLIPTLKKLPPRKNKLAKIKISQLLFEMEFDESVH
eukprot:Seg10781.1 transcript_id=Seg10781.1/GoldUCD/mRNA.D3Y31 product="hypothetical protein" protein_id=Seg10781.1/GoldUCD/D3Y31